MRKQKSATATTRSVSDDLRSRFGAISDSRGILPQPLIGLFHAECAVVQRRRSATGNLPKVPQANLCFPSGCSSQCIGGILSPVTNIEGNTPMSWTTPTLVEVCIGLEINGYLPADGYEPPEF
jgi:coenzyme PQQ precursor peptide PqqA